MLKIIKIAKVKIPAKTAKKKINKRLKKFNISKNKKSIKKNNFSELKLDYIIVTSRN